MKQERKRQLLKEAEERERLAKELEAADKPEPVRYMYITGAPRICTMYMFPFYIMCMC